jgi:hypothetical protein
MFEAVKVEDYGTHIAWSHDSDIAATTLRRLAQEQPG